MNAGLECGCGNLLYGETEGRGTVSDRVACEECGKQYVVTATMISEAR